jgi:hypothetical protein
MSETAKRYNLAIGLKNALEMLDDVKSVVHFAVNEECVKANECARYKDFSGRAKKPVFHIEYPSNDRQTSQSESSRKRWCADRDLNSLGHMFQTAIKAKKLDGWVQYCNGQVWRTPVISRSSRYSSLKYVDVEEQLPPPNSTQMMERQSPNDSAAIQAEIAKQDGYPFPPGHGSDQYITDQELGGYELEDVPESEMEKHNPFSAQAFGQHADEDEDEEERYYSRQR